jgi:hypothetical protein
VMSNDPCSPDHMDHRWNSLYPLPEPVAVRDGDTVAASINVDVDDERVSWRVTIGTGETRRALNMSTFFASFLTPDDLRRLSKSYVPQVGARGAMWRVGLDMVARGLTIGELEHQLAVRFPAVLSSAHKATEFVGHLVATAEA